jgi:hypothetical protein
MKGFSPDEFHQIGPWLFAEARRLYPDAFDPHDVPSTPNRILDTPPEMWELLMELLKEKMLPAPIQHALYALQKKEAKVVLNDGSYLTHLTETKSTNPLPNDAP